MTDMSSWRQTLEPSGFFADPDTLATNLYESSLMIFLRLIQHPSDDPAFSRSIRIQLQRYRLWGSDFDASEGGLDKKIVNSDRLKNVLLPALGRMADALTKIACRKNQDTELEDVISRIAFLNDQCLRANDRTDLPGDDTESDPFQIASILDELTSSGSDVSTSDEDSEIGELLRDVQSCIDCLCGLGSVLQESAESIPPEADRIYESTAVNPSLLHNTVWTYISSVLEAYPSIDPNFARRLGEANEQRYNRLQIQRDTASAIGPAGGNDSTSEGSIHKSPPVLTTSRASTRIAQSDFTVPSAKLSSTFDPLTMSTVGYGKEKQSKAPLSVTSFASSLDENGPQTRGRGLPKMPDDQPRGTPFDCTLCGDKLSNVWSSSQWV